MAESLKHIGLFNSYSEISSEQLRVILTLLWYLSHYSEQRSSDKPAYIPRYSHTQSMEVDCHSDQAPLDMPTWRLKEAFAHGGVCA